MFSNSPNGMIMIAALIISLFSVVVIWVIIRRWRWIKKALVFLNKNNLLTSNFSIKEFKKITKRGHIFSTVFYFSFLIFIIGIAAISIVVTKVNPEYVLTNDDVVFIGILAVLIAIQLSVFIFLIVMTILIKSTVKKGFLDTNTKHLEPKLSYYLSDNKHEYDEDNMAQFFNVWRYDYWTNLGFHIESYNDYLQMNWSEDQTKQIKIANTLFLAIMFNISNIKSSPNLDYDGLYRLVFTIVHYRRIFISRVI
ncbi:hypothetical protein [Mycoplasmopsis agassizii]|nr:hypothetical protein [Mycoplasmopsis agassizii]